MAARPFKKYALPSECMLLVEITGKVQIAVTLPKGHLFVVVHDDQVHNGGMRVKTSLHGKTLYLESAPYSSLRLRTLHQGGSQLGYRDEFSTDRLLDLLTQPDRPVFQRGLRIFCSSEPEFDIFRPYLESTRQAFEVFGKSFEQ